MPTVDASNDRGSVRSELGAGRSGRPTFRRSLVRPGTASVRFGSRLRDSRGGGGVSV